MPGNLEIAVLYEPSDNTTPPTDSSGRVRHKERRRTRTRRRWHGPERRQKIDREHVAEALRANGYEVSMYELSDESALLGLAKSKVDLILNMVEAYAGDDSLEAHVAAFLDLLELRYTGADPQALFLAQDKALAKKVFDFHGIRTPRFASVYRGKLDHVDDLEFPLIVKPASEDGSVGIDAGAVVRNLRELMERASMIQEKFDCAALIEEFIEGREIYVGIIGNDKPVALPPQNISRHSEPPPGRHAEDRRHGGEVGKGLRGVRGDAQRSGQRARRGRHAAAARYGAPGLFGAQAPRLWPGRHEADARRTHLRDRGESKSMAGAGGGAGDRSRTRGPQLRRADRPDRRARAGAVCSVRGYPTARGRR